MYDNPDHVRNKRHTVRYSRERDEMMRVLARLAGEQTSTFISEAAVLGALQMVREGLLDGVDEKTRQYYLKRLG